MIHKKGKFILTAILLFLSVVFVFGKTSWARQGGFLMFPIFFCSLFGFSVVFEKYLDLRRMASVPKSFVRDVQELIERSRIKEAIELCDRTPASISSIVKSGILKYDRPKEEIKEGMQGASGGEMLGLDENMDALVTILQILPLLGFLSVLGGAMKIALVVQSRAAASLALTANDLFPGLWQAMLACSVSLAVALPLLIAFNYFQFKINVMRSNMEQVAGDFLDFLMDRRMSL